MNIISSSVKILGGYSAVGRLCGVSYKSVTGWCKRGRLPRTEATGETCYAEIMAAANPEINKDALLSTVYANKAA